MPNPYRYRVEYPRTAQWWAGDWRDMSDWCRANIPDGEWEYLYEGFIFTEEKYRNWFVMRWL